MSNLIFPVAAGVLFLVFLAILAVVVWIKRRRSSLFDKKKLYNVEIM
jgi:hypothetical protein